MILKQGDRGADVRELQLKLKAAGYDPGDIDGDFGVKTEAAVFAFQADRPDIDDDGIAGPMTFGALDAAIADKKTSIRVPQQAWDPVPCEASTWTAFQRFVSEITGHPVRYGPGRGLWHEGKLVVTCGPGRLGSMAWPNALGRPYASFHCTSLANFFVGWLLRRNEDYTHAGNIPSVFHLMEDGPELHTIPGGGVYRGYGDAAAAITPDGTGAVRSGLPKTLDAKELLARRASLPTFMVAGQSTRRRDGSWKLWHHVVVFVVDHRDGDRLYRFAADGYKASKGYSGDPVRYEEITEKNVGRFAACAYRAYGLHTVDGTYGDKARPIAAIDFEDPR